MGSELMRRRFSRDEVERIVRRAAELQQGDPTGRTAQGTSLEEIERLAAAEGIDPRLVSEAIRRPARMGTDGRQPARFTDVVLHDGSGYARTEFAAGETVAMDLAFETADPGLRFHLRVDFDREDGVQVLAADTRREPWAPLTGRRQYRVRLVFPELPLAQGEFRVYAYLGDESALHVHDTRILRPGFSVVSPEYVVGLVAPRHIWSLADAGNEASAAAGAPIFAGFGRDVFEAFSVRARALIGSVLGGWLGVAVLRAIAVSSAAAAPPAAALASIAVSLFAIAAIGAAAFRLLILFFFFLGEVLEIFVDLRRDGCSLRTGHCHRARPRAVHAHPRPFEALVDEDFDRHAVACLDLGEFGPLLVEKVDRRFSAGPEENPVAATSGCLVLDDPERTQTR